MSNLIRMLESWRNLHGLDKTEMAELLQTNSSQTYTNWIGRNSLPKEYYDLAYVILNSQSVKEAKSFHGKIGEFEFRGQKATQEIGAHYANTESAPSIAGDVPLISWVQAGEWNEASDIYHPGECEDLIPCIAKHSSRTFALRVTGNSMTSATGKSYPSGTIIFVDPEQRGGVTPGDRVIAKLNGSNSVTFKQLAQDRDGMYLKPLNTIDHEPIYGEFRILGKVIGAWLEE